MSSWIDIEANRMRLQTALNIAVKPIPPLVVDGVLGWKSDAALKSAYEKFHITPRAPFDDRVLPYLHLTTETAPMADSTIISGAIATAEDYFLNFISSKINWAAAVMVGVLVTFVSTHFGFTIPPDASQWLTVEIAAGFGVLIGILRTFFNKPKVISGTAVTVVK